MAKQYKVDKVFEAHGLRCVIITTRYGHHCGYVGVSKEHPFYGLDYCDKVPSNFMQYHYDAEEKPVGDRGIIDLLYHNPEAPKVGILFDVHGGITFSGNGRESNYPIEGDEWWFGYDCAHAGDLSPGFQSFGNVVYRDLNFCIKQCEKLAAQLATITWD